MALVPLALGCGGQDYEPSEVAGRCSEIDEAAPSGPLIAASTPDSGAAASPQYCFARQLLPQTCSDPADPREGQVACVVVESRPLEAGLSCDCQAPGRTDPEPAAISDEMRASGDCLCEIVQLSGAEADACRTQTSVVGSIAGFCYVDPAQNLGSADLVAICPSAERRAIRFVGSPALATDGTVWMRCSICVDQEAPASGRCSQQARTGP